jgi:hypothetical protein
MAATIHKKVRFQGVEYWLHQSMVGDDWFNLSPLHHYSEEGELIINPVSEVSYAIVNDGDILRYGEVIGKQSELEDI